MFWLIFVTVNFQNNDQQNLPKLILWCCSVYNQITSDVWRCE